MFPLLVWNWYKYITCFRSFCTPFPPLPCASIWVQHIGVACKGHTCEYSGLGSGPEY